MQKSEPQMSDTESLSIAEEENSHCYNNIEMQCKAVSTISVLAITNIDNQKTLMRNGAIDVIIQAMQIHSNQLELQEHACGINLTYCPSNN